MDWLRLSLAEAETENPHDGSGHLPRFIPVDFMYINKHGCSLSDSDTAETPFYLFWKLTLLSNNTFILGRNNRVKSK